ncbi:MAG: Crp/Fnr family transcriptional regulator, partial [Oscillospiraceae bacterium]|nr:Crp/Fnr family transcriptional regulator [Oscillospiraceae bacterium]
LNGIEREELIASAVLQEYKAGALIHNCTDANSPGVQIVKRGRARVYISSPDGKQLTLQRIGDNQLFAIGVSCVLNNKIFDVNLETETNCEVLLIPRGVCKKLFDSNERVRTSTMEIVASRFAHTMRILEAIAFTSTRNRLANVLIEQCDGLGMVKATHAGIAADLGTTREVVTRILHQFQEDGLVTLRQREIHITDKDSLLGVRGEYLGYIGDLLYPKV